MGIVLIVGLLVAAMLVGGYDRYAAQREYASLYAERHGGIPPLADWFFKSDPDEDVDRLRRMHRNLTILGSALGIVVILLVLGGGLR